jgi:hypothetical protein
MKKIIFLFIILFLSLGVQAQLVEHYENPQRFMIIPFMDHSNMNVSFSIHPGLANLYNNTIFFEIFGRFDSRKYTNDQRHTIYGIAIPYLLRQDDFWPSALSPETRWDMLQHFYDTISQHQHVIICEPSQSYGSIYDLLATAPIHFGSNAIIGNYFKLPDSDSSQCATNNYSTYFPVIEVYFDQPVVVSHDFVIGTNLPPRSIHQRHNNRNMIHNIDCGVLSILLNHNDPSIPLWTTLYKEDSIHLNILAQWSSDSWGGPFPILTPAPCMPPIWLNVVEQHRKGASFEWRAQYSNSYFELEYGPQGFDEGTGTLIGPIYPDAQYNCHVSLDSLVMDADYTVRVRSYCNSTGGYSDWTSLDFHTDGYFDVYTATNNDDWGLVYGGGTFLAGSEVRLVAYPRSAEHRFLNWSDGSNQNPRVFSVTQDTSFLAIFANSDDNDSVGLASATQPFVSLTPNPAKKSTVLACSEIILEWSLLDIQGRQAAFGKPCSYTSTIDLSSLHPAIYILSVRTSKGLQTKKLVVR